MTQPAPAFSPQRRRLLAAAVATALGSALHLPSAFAGAPRAARASTLAALSRTLFPLAVFSESQHAAAAAKMEARCAADPALNALVDRALAALPADWADGPAATREAVLRTQGDPALIKLARQSAVGPLFGDPAVWPHFDYPGPSIAFGGYLDRPLVDLPWLEAHAT